MSRHTQYPCFFLSRGCSRHRRMFEVTPKFLSVWFEPVEPLVDGRRVDLVTYLSCLPDASAEGLVVRKHGGASRTVMACHVRKERESETKLGLTA